METFDVALHGGYFITEGIVALLLVNEWQKGRVYAPYRWLAVFFVFQQLSFLVSPVPAWWTTATAWFTSL